MDEFEILVESVTEIANALNKKKGYTTTFTKANVAIILEAHLRLQYEMLKKEGE